MATNEEQNKKMKEKINNIEKLIKEDKVNQKMMNIKILFIIF